MAARRCEVMKWVRVTACSVAIASAPAWAQTPSTTAPWTSADSESELSSDATECFAFDTVASECARNSDRPDLAASATQAAKSAEGIAIAAGRAAHIMDAALQARAQAYVTDQEDQIEKSCANMSILIVKYAKACKAFTENPLTRFNQLQHDQRASPWP